VQTCRFFCAPVARTDQVRERGEVLAEQQGGFTARLKEAVSKEFFPRKFFSSIFALLSSILVSTMKTTDLFTVFEKLFIGSSKNFNLISSSVSDLYGFGFVVATRVGSFFASFFRLNIPLAKKFS
jgi:hypothetical protein